MAGAPPDMVITAYDKTRNTGAQVGVGWTQEDGSIALVLNPGTALIFQPNVSYKVKPKISEARPPVGTYKPTRYGYEAPQRPAATPTHAPAPPSSDFEDMQDDVPF